MRDAYRTVAYVVALFFNKNDITVQNTKQPERSQDEFSAFEVVAGLEADIFDSPDMNLDETAFVDKVFVHAGDLASALDVTTQTARNRLKELEAHGVVREHGDVDTGAKIGNVHLYRPAIENFEEFVDAVESVAGNQSSQNADGAERVTPSDFKYINGSKFQFKRDDSVVVDVKKPKSGTIKDSLEEQLGSHGLEATSMKNFSYQLRDRAGEL